jgi:hypothetical protein
MIRALIKAQPSSQFSKVHPVYLYLPFKRKKGREGKGREGKGREWRFVPLTLTLRL